jgi:hypothetical protein
MSHKEVPTVLVAYPREFLCYKKFKRKLSSILSNFSQFNVAFMKDYNGYVAEYLSSDRRGQKAALSMINEESLSAITHAIIFSDGEVFSHLIENLGNKKIKLRVIDILITRVANKDKGEDYGVYIGRGSAWGNPYAVGFGASIGEEQNDRDEAIRKFKYDFERDYLKSSKEESLQLKGKVLGCHCKPYACHGDVIAEYLNSLDDGM